MGKWILAAGGAAVVAFYALFFGDSRPPAVDRDVCAAAEVGGVDADKYRAALCDPAQSQAIRKAVSP